MATITGFIEKIKFRNEENGYTVLSVTDQSDGDEVIMVGTLSYAAEGDMIQASGRMIEHPVYGEQLQIESYEMKTPQDAESMERYLGSGAIKGIGAALAARIVRHFKADTFRVMEEEPERLSEVKGISEKMAMAIAEQVEEKKGMREAMMFLQNYGITLNLAAKIYQEYGPKLYSIIKENPYKLADDIPGVGFKMADEIAEKVGIFRLRLPFQGRSPLHSSPGISQRPYLSSSERIIFPGGRVVKSRTDCYGKASDGYANRPQSSGKNSPRQRTAGISGLFFPLLLSGTEHGPYAP